MIQHLYHMSKDNTVFPDELKELKEKERREANMKLSPYHAERDGT